MVGVLRHVLQKLASQSTHRETSSRPSSHQTQVKTGGLMFSFGPSRLMTSSISELKKKQLKRADTPFSGIEVFSLHTGQIIHSSFWSCLATSAWRHFRQKLCWQSRIFGSMDRAKQIGHSMCTCLIFQCSVWSAASAILVRLGCPVVRIQTNVSFSLNHPVNDFWTIGGSRLTRCRALIHVIMTGERVGCVNWSHHGRHLETPYNPGFFLADII